MGRMARKVTRKKEIKDKKRLEKIVGSENHKERIRRKHG